MYPVAARWAWHPTGWLKLRGFFDYGGSGVVHMLGGICALMATLIVGPRIGRFGPSQSNKKNGSQKLAFRGHSTTVIIAFSLDTFTSNHFAFKNLIVDGHWSFYADDGHHGLQHVIPAFIESTR